MMLLGNGLCAAKLFEDALSVQEAEVSMKRRLGASEIVMLDAQSNLANTYQSLGRSEALSMQRDVYFGHLKLHGEENKDTLLAANNYLTSLLGSQRFNEAKALLRKTIPVARRVLGASHILTLKMKKIYASALYRDDCATLDDLREAVNTLEETECTARRVLGGAHPTVVGIEQSLYNSRVVLRNREASMSGDVSSICDKLGAMTPGDAQLEGTIPL
jgi:hypothetical protein